MVQAVSQRYNITERIDAGGMAEVFKGTVTSLKGFEKEVAIKRILPSLTKDQRFVRMFLDEAKLSLHLNHANIVQVFDIGQADETYFIVMEYINGCNLKDILNSLAQRGERLPVEQAIFITMEICKGLDYAHSKSKDGQALGVVHRDISPPNVLVSRDGEVKITDFGLAKAVIQLEHTDPGIVKGKFGYLSPEAAYGEAVDPRTDIFAAGIVLWEMLAGKRLFLGKTDLKTLEQVRKAHIPALSSINPDVPPELEEILRKALHRERDQRYSSARQLGEALARLLFSQGRTVTTYDLAALVGGVLDHKPKKSKPLESGDQNVIDILIQNQLEKFISVEERRDFDELNIVGATPLTIDDLDGQSASSYPAFGFEDPRTWSDAFGEDAPGGTGPVATQAEVSGPKTVNSGAHSASRITVHSPPGGKPAPPPPTLTPPDTEDEGGVPVAIWAVFIVLLVLVVAGLGYLIFTML